MAPAEEGLTSDTGGPCSNVTAEPTEQPPAPEIEVTREPKGLQAVKPKRLSEITEADASPESATNPPVSFQPRPRVGRGKSPRAFRSLAQGIQGIARAQAIVDEGVPRNVDVTGLVQRIAVTLGCPATYKKVSQNMFEKHRVPSSSSSGEPGPPVLPVACLPEIFQHWAVPQEYGSSIFWAMLRKQEKYWDTAVLPRHIAFEDFQEVLLKVLRRVRDKYCYNKVAKNHFVTQNPKTLEEEYTIGDACGKGAFGECFWVTHRMSKTKDRRVCKKILKEDASVPSEEVVSELNTLKLLDHPHIVRVFEWFESETSYFLVLEAAHGGDVKSLLAREREREGSKGLEEKLVNLLTSQALRALVYIHNMRIIHRDIKPANMLLAKADMSRPRLLLADFGVAELVEESVRMTSLMRGTVAYMAPEVFANDVSPRSDVWALGIVVYELICGERPFVAENPMAMYMRLKGAPVNFEPLREAEASDLAIAFVDRALSKVQSERPTAMEAFADPWMTSFSSSSSLPAGRHARKIRRTLTEFSSFGHFTKAAMNCIAAQLDTGKIEGLTEIFKAIDTNCDGKLSLSELAVGLRQLGVEDDAITHLVDVVDMNHDGEIQFSEFVASLLHTQAKLVEDVLYQAFHVIDVNHDGVISLDELRLMLSGEGPLTAVLPDGKTVEQVLAEVDTSRDGVISFHEFKAYLTRDEQTDMPKPLPTPVNLGAPVDSGDQLDVLLPQLAKAVGRSEAELVRQAHRLSDVHWITTVGDLTKLASSDWPRLGLPLKLERVLRNHVGC